MSDARSTGPPIDFVIMWVDGSEPETARAHEEAIAERKAAGLPMNDGPNRHRDNGELLFLLRSIQAHMPWYRQIVLVTNGQRPPYVDLSNDAIRLVTHAEIFPPGFRTPSFNTYAIDTCISSIRGLSDIYVRFSDDFLLGRNVSKGDFLGQADLGRNLVGSAVFNTGSSQYLNTLQNNAIAFWREYGYLPLANFLHVPQLRHRTTHGRMTAAWPDWVARTRQSRFRDTGDLNTLFLYPYFSLFHRRRTDLAQLASGKPAPGIVDLAQRPNHRKAYMQVQIGEKADWRAALNRISRDPPTFFNINDNLGDIPAERDRRYVGRQLRRLFPKPSPFEINPSTFPGYAADGARA